MKNAFILNYEVYISKNLLYNFILDLINKLKKYQYLYLALSLSILFKHCNFC